MSDYDQRNCAGEDVEVFFPVETDRRGVELAKSICSGCPWLGPCLEAAMRFETSGKAQRHGIYGGMTPRQRADLSRKRDKEAAA